MTSFVLLFDMAVDTFFGCNVVQSNTYGFCEWYGSKKRFNVK